MPECHTCPHAKDVQAGRYSELPFDQTPCGSCKLIEDSSWTVEFDMWRADGPDDRSGGTEFVNGHHRPIQRVHDWPSEALKEEVIPDIPLDVMREVVTSLLVLLPEVRDVVCWRFAGFKYADIAAIQGTTMAAAEQRHRKAIRREPMLQWLFPSKVKKQKVRKPHRKGARDEQGSNGPVEA